MVLWFSVTAALPGAAAQQTKPHQATGTIASMSATKLTMTKQFGRNKAQWNFTIPPKTTVPAEVSKGARVTIYYHEEKDIRIADRIKLLDAKKDASKPAGSKPDAPSRH